MADVKIPTPKPGRFLAVRNGEYSTPLVANEDFYLSESQGWRRTTVEAETAKRTKAAPLEIAPPDAKDKTVNFDDMTIQELREYAGLIGIDPNMRKGELLQSIKKATPQ